MVNKLNVLRRGRKVWLVSGNSGPCRRKGVIKMPCAEMAITIISD